MAKTIIVTAKVKEICESYPDTKLRTSKELILALEKRVGRIVMKACWRAVRNGRTTVMPKDL